MLSLDIERCAPLATWLRGEREVPPVLIVGQFTKQGANIKAGHRWSHLRLDHELELWIGKELIDQTIGLRPTMIRKMRGAQLLHILPASGELAVTSERLVREFVIDHGQLRRLDEITADPETRTAQHPYFPSQPILIAKYKSLSAAQPFALTYDDAKTIVAARSLPRRYPTPIHSVIPSPGERPLAYIFGGSLRHPTVNNLTGIVSDVPVARAGNVHRITAGETAEGRPRYHRVFRHTGSQGIAVELEHGIPIATYPDPAPTDISTRRPLLVKRRWPDRLPQECVPSYITSRWLFMLPALFTGQVVKKEGVVWVQKRPLYVGSQFAGHPAETIAISSAQAERVGTLATFQVRVMDQRGERVRSCGFTWQGRVAESWSSEMIERIEQIRPIAQRRVLDQGIWLPLTTEMLAQGWDVSDIGDLVRCVTDLGLGRETWVAHYVETAIREYQGYHTAEAIPLRRIKGELLQWLVDCVA